MSAMDPEPRAPRPPATLDLRWRLARWVVVAVLAALVALAFRGYLSPVAALDFANLRLC
jgi:hypothetical protein